MIKAINEFDYLHKDYDSFTEKSATKCKYILHCFYVAEQDDDTDGIVQIQFASCTYDTLLKQVKDFEDYHLVQFQDPQAQFAKSLVSPLEQLADSYRTTQEAVSKMTVLQ